ncbi:MAG: HNH endonuclease [Deltaproteobacteria bacterium]|nr:HNH endonuclease [Deltaproteobacteria bacterium]
MKAFIGITDGDWYRHLAAKPDLDEANFWKPGGKTTFKAVEPGGLFLFKLHAPHHYIVGGGHFAHFSIVPLYLAWEAFGEANGAVTRAEMHARIAKYRRDDPGPNPDIGCILLTQTFFLPENQWIPAPADWPRNTVQGKTYNLTVGEGARLHEQLQLARRDGALLATEAPDQHPGWGPERLVRQRLGQRSFRILVTDTYGRRCAVTGERTLPALEAAHIKEFASGGPHAADNGLLLRRDLHALYDSGYLTFTPDHHIEVSGKIREEFENGRDYYAKHGELLRLPDRPDLRPNPEYLRWHNDHRYLG